MVRPRSKGNPSFDEYNRNPSKRYTLGGGQRNTLYIRRKKANMTTPQGGLTVSTINIHPINKPSHVSLLSASFIINFLPSLLPGRFDTSATFPCKHFRVFSLIMVWYDRPSFPRAFCLCGWGMRDEISMSGLKLAYFKVPQQRIYILWFWTFHCIKI